MDMGYVVQVLDWSHLSPLPPCGVLLDCCTLLPSAILYQYCAVTEDWFYAIAAMKSNSLTPFLYIS